uniref:CHK domain-containing protein n=1 Tax=Steinernema glaseri TaxID=37863 RepID=A0A1I8ANI7_9BILA
MTVALANLKWVLGSLLENDRQFQYYSKCADLSNVAAKRDGDVVKIRFEFGDENSYDGVLKFAKNEAEVLFYKTYSIQSDFPLPRYVSSHKNMLLIQNMEPYGVTNTTYLGLKKQQVFNLAIHLSDLHAFHLLSHSNTSLWLPEERPITVDEFQLAVSDVDSVLSSGDVSSLCSYLKLHQSTSKKEDLKPVCVHGNFTTDVIFWEKDEEGDPKNIVAAVVGWNGVHL